MSSLKKLEFVRTGPKGLRIEPCSLAEANEMVKCFHRHHKPCVGHKFSMACYNGPHICGVVILGRPVSRMVDFRKVIEITRCATDGTPNAISKLYGAACRASKAMGYLEIQTYTLPEEGGSSLKASGFIFVGEAGGGDWNKGNESTHKNRRTDQPMGIKWKWRKTL